MVTMAMAVRGDHLTAMMLTINDDENDDFDDEFNGGNDADAGGTFNECGRWPIEMVTASDGE